MTDSLDHFSARSFQPRKNIQNMEKYTELVDMISYKWLERQSQKRGINANDW